MSNNQERRPRTINDLINEQRQGLRGRVTATEILLYNSSKTRFLRARRGTDPAAEEHRARGTWWEIVTGAVEATYTTDSRGVRHYGFRYKDDERATLLGLSATPRRRVEKKAEVLALAAKGGYEAF